MNTIDSVASYDRYDRYETPSPSVPASPGQPRQQQRALHRAGASISSDLASRSGRSTPVSSQRGLRRTPRFIGTPSPQPQERSRTPRATHLEAVSVGISPPGLFAPVDPTSGAKARAGRTRPPPQPRQLSQDLPSDPFEEDSTTLPRSFVPPRTSSRRDEVHPFVRISKHTHSAILWAVEEALRNPNPFTPDFEEENASMSDLRGPGSMPSTTNGFSSPPTNAASLPLYVGTPSPLSVKGPKKIMEERNAREKLKRQQQAAQAEEERERLELELMERASQRQQQEEAAQRRQAERQSERQSERKPPAAGTGPSVSMGTGGDPSTPISTQPIDPTGSRRRQQQGAAPSSTPRVNPGPAQFQQRPSRFAGAQPQAEPMSPLLVSGGPNVAVSGASLPGNSGVAGQTRAQFPHAFERWEALSAHWEGLTSFWIRKLQQHAEEIDRDPLSAQLSRQVTDLSAAGANLFHAVVELQRLRASSERKFQRWFFETRAELERHEETKAMLERALAEERASKAAAIKDAVEKEQNNSRVQRRMQEMQRELQISKEEARRAWEELGRREGEEHDRNVSLSQGQPTLVGGVQVVPMTQGVPSRGNTSMESRQAEITSPQYPQYSQPAQLSNVASPGLSSSGGYYQRPQGADDEERPYTAEGQSEGAYSEGEYLSDVLGNFVRDARGNKVPYPGTPGDDDSDVGTDDEYSLTAEQAQAARDASVSYPPSASQYSSQPDYQGAEYAPPGWEGMQGRHHHPTRLSDVLEEEETRSRTSAGQSGISRR